MSLDDRLDALLSTTGQPISPLSDDEDTRVLAPLLAAAERLAPLRDAQPATHFADQLERQILARAVGHATVAPAQTGEGYDALPVLSSPTSEGASAKTPARDGEAPTLPNMAAPLWPRVLRKEAGTPARAARKGRRMPVWARSLAAACVLLVLTSSLFVAAANAQPGSPLFGLRQAQEWAQLALASPADKARLHLQYANDALAALDQAVAQHRGDPAYAGALDALQSELAAAASSIAALPAGQTHDALATQLAALQQHARDDLRAALSGLGWNDRVATTTVLGVLGESVPRVNTVAIHTIAGQSGQAASHGMRAVRIVVSGNGFVAGTQLVINGQPEGTVLSVTPDTLVAQLSLDLSSPHMDSVGIENPDGTAAQTADIGHGAAVTPTPAIAPTATPHHGHGGHSGGNG